MKFFNDFWESKWAYRALALLLAIGLFAYVNAENINNTRQDARTETSITATAKRTLKVPLQLNADSDKYFITGYPEKVDVTIEGAASLVTVTANTQNFRIIGDLSKLGVGKHTVHLRQSGLNKALTYKIKPATITVKIQDRKTRRLPIQVKYNKDSLAPGYTVGTPKLGDETADITGAKGEIDRVYQVVANVVMKRNTKDDVNEEVMLQALDQDGNTVNVVVNPETVHVTLPIYLPSKHVKVSLDPTGTPAQGKNVTLSTNTQSVEIYGAKAMLDDISTLDVPVSVTGVASSTTKTISLTKAFPKLTAATPESIKVQVIVSDTTSATSDTDASATSSSSKKDATSSSTSQSSASSADKDAASKDSTD
ncbi:CdaR family protein [Lacticaseibacillus jixiensis]|uniref:CdaR family protein n=1 Tax=Lacticaseibacillus jixiensis TaxID=3231926 RepID=UPI0036F3D6B4